MIIIISMVIGYILGILPFLYPQITKQIKCNKKNLKEEVNNKDATEIINEWLNGPKKSLEDNTENESDKITPEDIMYEYMTGSEKKYGK